MKITVEFKQVYGNDLCYPVCDKAKLFAKLCNRKTLSVGDIETIKQLGYAIEVKGRTV
jgi:hypothetical protein